MSFLNVRCDFSEQTINDFKCWEVRPEFLDKIKPHEVKKVRNSRNTTAQKFYLY